MKYAVWFTAVHAAAACPVCNTTTGREIRESIVSPDAGIYLLAAALPFAVCAIAIRFLVRGDVR